MPTSITPEVSPLLMCLNCNLFTDARVINSFCIVKLIPPENSLLPLKQKLIGKSPNVSVAPTGKGFI